MSDANLPDKQESTIEKSAEPLVPEPKEIQNGENADKSSVIEPEKGLKRHGTFRKLTDEELGGHVMDSVTSRSIDKEDSSNYEELKANEQIAKATNSEETGATEAAEIIFKEKGTEAEVNKVDSISLTAETKEKKCKLFIIWEKYANGFSFGRKEAEDRDILRQLEEDENFNLALSRYLENSAALKSQSEKDQEAVDTCAKNLRKTFNEIKTGIEISHDKMLLKGIDWEFWSDVVNDYSAVVNDKPQQLLDHVSQGIPKELRGMVWQLICNSKSLQLEEFYRDGKNKNQQL
ncbi:gtpase-activating protein [Brettanomyces bruxellensis AWRI1499]|nr:gtpase-activating protein [Brettanomyces bruxellensis AWRI1499]